MPDMLVKLYQVCDGTLHDEALKAQGIQIRRAIAPEMHKVVAFVKDMFGEGWASECTVAFARAPVACYVAVREGALLGFACYDATYRNFFGPTGVDERERGKGIGTCLMRGCLNDMAAQGYGYCIIGSAGPVAYYKKTVNAIEIDDSWPGIYKGMI